MPSLDALPWIDYWGARRIDGTISKDAAGGALIGILLASPLSHVATLAAALGRQHAGLLGAQVGWALGWVVSAYAALLLIAHWKSLDDAEGESS